jgi:hypothetical protein
MYSLHSRTVLQNMLLVCTKHISNLLQVQMNYYFFYVHNYEHYNHHTKTIKFKIFVILLMVADWNFDKIMRYSSFYLNIPAALSPKVD